MKYFSVPADFKTATIDRFVELHQKYPDARVLETYGQVTIGNVFGSGRSADCLPTVDITTLKEYIDYAKSKGVDFSYTVNASCMGNIEFTARGVEGIEQFLGELYAAGVQNLTIALPSLIELVQKCKYPFKIKGSTICQITNANKAQVFKRFGLERIVVDESINREIETLKRIRNLFGEKVELIVNAVCLKNCTNRMFHYNQMSHDSMVQEEQITTYYSHRCMVRRCEDVSNLLKISWIRPEDLKYYTAIGINYFKIQGRQAVLKGDLIKTLEHYFQESFAGNLMDLIDLFSSSNSFIAYLDNQKLDGFLQPFVENKNFCIDDCSNCGYCAAFAKKSVDYEKTLVINERANKFYQDFDQFNQLMEKAHAIDSQESENSNFDFD